MGTFWMKQSKDKPLNHDLQLRFLHRLSRILANGYPLLEALQTMRWDKKLSPVAITIETALMNGETIDKAFEQAHFHHSIISFLYFSQIHGNLLSSIDKSIELFENRLYYSKKFKQLLRYPIILFTLFVTLLFFINKYVFPSFLDIFQANASSTSFIHLFMTTIQMSSQLLLVLFIIVISFIIAWRYLSNKIPIQRKISLYKSIPVLQYFMTLYTSFLFTTQMSMLLKSGMELQDILRALTNQRKLPIIAHYASLLTNELSHGNHISYIISQLPLLDNQLVDIFQESKNMSTLQQDLSIYADILLEEFHDKMMKFITLFQPIFFIIIAIFIVTIYMAMMWPMFELIKTI